MNKLTKSVILNWLLDMSFIRHLSGKAVFLLQTYFHNVPFFLQNFSFTPLLPKLNHPTSLGIVIS